MNELDKFFATHDFASKEPLSNCCGAKVQGETYKNFGRCSDCLEMAEFSKDE